jgi:thioredoxin reductase (NADPH)
VLRQVERTDAALVLGSKVMSADLVNRIVTLEDGCQLKAMGIIIATGVRRRQLGVPGEREFTGRGILESGVRDRSQVAGGHVVIVGGGDAALENAILLSETAAKVTVIHRRGAFRARDEFVARLEYRPNVEILLNSTLTRITGDKALMAVEVGSGADTRSLNCDHLLIRIGVQPNTELFEGQIVTDELGFISIDSMCRTNLAQILAAGDVASPLAPTIASATGMAATAVKTIAGTRSHT